MLVVDVLQAAGTPLLAAKLHLVSANEQGGKRHEAEESLGISAKETEENA